MHGNRFNPVVMGVLFAGLVLAATGCMDRDAQEHEADGDSFAAVASAPARDGAERDRDRTDSGEARQIELTDARLLGYARGLEKEAEIIKRPDRSKPDHMGVYISRHNPDEECREVLAAAGMDADEYLAVGRVVDQVFNMLTFQGKLEPRRSLDLERASEEMRRRIQGDPFDELPPASAAALRRHYEALATPWSIITRQLAQFG